MNVLRAVEANLAEMRLLCVLAVIHWELETGVLRRPKQIWSFVMLPYRVMTKSLGSKD